MDVRTKIKTNAIEIEMLRQAIQAKAIRLALVAETPVERRIRELEASNALLKGVLADEQPVVTHRVLCRVGNRVQEVICD